MKYRKMLIDWLINWLTDQLIDWLGLRLFSTQIAKYTSTHHHQAHKSLEEKTKPEHRNKAPCCNNMPARWKRVISTDELQFNHNAIKMLLTEK